MISIYLKMNHEWLEELIVILCLKDRFKDWEASGIKVVPVLSDPDSSWNGEIGTVQVRKIS